MKWKSDEKDLWFNSVITVSEGGEAMSIAKKRLIILLVIALVAFVLGRAGSPRHLALSLSSYFDLLLASKYCHQPSRSVLGFT